MVKQLTALLWLAFLQNVLCSQNLVETAKKAYALKGNKQKIEALLKVYEADKVNDPATVPFKIKIMQDVAAYSQASKHAEGLMAANFYLGNEYNNQNLLLKAIESYIRCQKFAEQYKNNYYLSRGLMGIGLIHYKQERWKAAYDLFMRSLNVSRLLNDKTRLARQLYLGGLCKGRMKDYQGSLLLLDSALAIFVADKYTDAILETRVGQAYALRHMGNIDSAKGLYAAVLKELKTGHWHDVYARVICETGLAEIALLQNNLAEAFAFATSAKIALQADSYGSWIHLDLYSVLIRIYQAKGDYKSAMQYQTRYQQLQDTARNSDAGVLAIERQTLFDFEKQQALRESQFQSEMVNQKRKRIWLIAIVGVMLLLVLVVFWAYRLVSKQRKLSEKLLLNILPEETANELKLYGAAIPKKHQEVAILFADIKGFTHIAEHMPPENIVKKLDDFFSRFDDIMLKYGLEKIKTIGDAYMAVAGLNSSSKNPSLDAVKAAWNMIEDVEKLNLRYGKNETPFSFRIGINTGPVISGVVGKNKYSYDIWGDSVNVAARMEQSSHPGSINIAGYTWEKVKHVFECTYRGKIPAKNKGHIDMYYVDYKK